jgi:hypothetical protein
LNKETHIIKFAGFEMEKGKIPFSLLLEFGTQLRKIAEGSLRLYVEGKSFSKKGRLPDWLSASLDFNFAGLKKGSTILEIEAPVLKNTLRQVQLPIYYDLEANEVMENTALSLAMVGYEKAFLDSVNTNLLDKHLLKEMMVFNKLLLSEKCSIDFSTKNKNFHVSLTKDNFTKVKKLEENTPQPIKMRITGKLDVMKHTTAQLEIVTEKGRIRALLNNDITFDKVKPYFGDNVSIIGEVNFNPAHAITSVELISIEKAKEGDNFFTQLGNILIKDKTDIKQLIVEQDYKGVNENRFDMVINELQIEESIDDLLNMLSK